MSALPFCPAPDVNGEPTVRDIDWKEATAWRLHAPPSKMSLLRLWSLLLEIFQSDRPVLGCKERVDGLPIQRLGYHASGGLDIVYSRDVHESLSEAFWKPWLLCVMSLESRRQNVSQEQ
eukprot:s9255_g1.t1